MGCGSVVKTVVRIAVPAIVSLAGGAPLAVAISAAAATGATGGSFKESLTAGATSFVGSSIARGVSGSFSEAAQGAAQTVNPGTIVGEAAPFQGAFSSAADAAALGGTISDTGLGQLAAGTAALPDPIGRGLAGTLTQTSSGALVPTSQLLSGGIDSVVTPLEARAAAGSGSFATHSPAAVTAIDDAVASGTVTPAFKPSFGSKFLQESLTPEQLQAIDQPLFPNAPDTSGLLDPVTEGLKGFADVGKTFTEGLFGTGRTPFDTFVDLAPKSLSEITGADVIGKLVGFTAESTLNDVLLAPLEFSVPAMEAMGFEPEAIEVLRNEARIAQLQGVFDDLQQIPDLNPGVAPEEFSNILGSGVQSINEQLGPEITQAQFDDVFGDRQRLGEDIIRFEEEGRRERGIRDVQNLFADTGELFNPTVDDDIISSILDEKQGEASAQVARFQARGNLNPTGGRSANVFFEEERPQAEERVSGLGESVLGQARDTLGGIESRAIEEAGRFQLGKTPDFDITPFQQEREQFIDRTLGTDDTPGTLGSDIRGALGTEQLFDFGGAVREAGAQQGLVSGAPSQQALLDQFTARSEGFADRFGRRRDTRGLGSAGAF
jgi:hypothetical protein